MPSNGYNVTNVFANQTGPIALAQLDADISQAASALNTLATYGNYFVDSSGSPNTITVTVPGNLTVTYVAGLPLQIQVANTNTSGTVNINVNGLGNKAVFMYNGDTPPVGSLLAGGVLSLVYDGTLFRILSQVSPASFSAVKASATTRSSVTALSNDPELVVAVPSGGKYRVTCFIQCSQAAGGAIGISCNLNYSGTITNPGSYFLADDKGGVSYNAPQTILFASSPVSGGNYSIGTLASLDYLGWLRFDGILICSTVGNLGFSWAQNSSSVNATKVEIGSFLTVARIA